MQSHQCGRHETKRAISRNSANKQIKQKHARQVKHEVEYVIGEGIQFAVGIIERESSVQKRPITFILKDIFPVLMFSQRKIKPDRPQIIKLKRCIEGIGVCQEGNRYENRSPQ